MIKFAASLITVVCAAGCTNASAQSYDSSNPVNCTTVFGIAGGHPSATPEVRRLVIEKTTAIALKHGGTEWINRIKPASIEFAKKLEAENNRAAVTRLLDECMAA